MKSIKRWSLVVLVMLALGLTAHADFEVIVEQALSLENAGILYQGYEGPEAGYVPTVVRGDDIDSPSNVWSVNFLKTFTEEVSSERGRYVLLRYEPDPTPEDGPETDFLREGINFEMVSGMIPGGGGTAEVSFDDLPILGTSEAIAGEYTLFVFEMPESKWVYDEETDTSIEVAYTDDDLKTWIEWTYGVDYDAYVGDVPMIYDPTEQKSFSFNYVALEEPECCSSVAFLPGLKGSVLKFGSDTLWPAGAFDSDIPKLALNEDGTSVNDVVVDGILPSFKIDIPGLGSVGPEIYSEFQNFMDGVVASATMNVREWKALPYDWRYDPAYIVANDIRTSEGPTNLVDEIEALAENSYTGKVTLVTHSMGGLVGKALIRELEAQGKADLIDTFVMVGSPQLGTPQAVAALLHGDDEGIPGLPIIPNFISSRATARAYAHGFPGAYSLLPALQYFEKVLDPVITFADEQKTLDWRAAWGDTINAYDSYREFLTGTNVERDRPFFTAVSLPEVLKSNLLTAATDTHADLDTYEIPEGIRAVEIVGWGRETTKAVHYFYPHSVLHYDVAPTIEGDGTVVYKSANAVGEEQYYFNLFDFNRDSASSAGHATLMNTIPVQESLSLILTGLYSIPQYFSIAKPEPESVTDMLRVSTHSPVTLGAYDSEGNFTGINPAQDLTADYLYVEEGIPGSSFVASGEVQSLFLRKGGAYQVAYQGTGAGSTTLVIERFSEDALSTLATFSDMPTTPELKATIVLSAEEPEEAQVVLDQNGDGVPDAIVEADGSTPTLHTLISNLKIAVAGLSVSDRHKAQLLKKISHIERALGTHTAKQARILEKTRVSIEKKLAKGRIDAVRARALLDSLDLLIANAGIVPLSADLIADFKRQVALAQIPAPLKSRLEERIVRLERIARLNTALLNMTATVTRKAGKGVLTDTEAQNLINLLIQIQNVYPR